MKIRTDFVTNSSSSSFVLSFKNEEDLENFKESCEDYEYKDFYNLINWTVGDYLRISNDTKNEISFREIVNESKLLEYDWPENVIFSIDKLLEEDFIFPKYGYKNIFINGLDKFDFNVDKIGFEDFDNDIFSVELINNKAARDKRSAYDMIKHFIFYETGCDYLDIYCKNKDGRRLNVVLDEIKSLNWPDYVKKQIDELYEKDMVFTEYQSAKILLNDFKNDTTVDLDAIGFEEICNHDFRVAEEKPGDYYNGISEDLLKLSDVRAFIYNHLKEKIVSTPEESCESYSKRRKDYRESKEFELILKDYLCNTLLKEYEKRINDSILTMNGMVWDTNGGTLEWAIRKGFILDEFGRFCLACWNVG